MSDSPTLSNSAQLLKMLFLGGIFVPLLGIVPASMPFFFDNFPPDAPVRNPACRIGLVAVAGGIGLAVLWHTIHTSPKAITLGDKDITLDYLMKSIARPYSDIQNATLHDRDFTVGGRGTIPMRVKETIFTIRFRGGPTAKVSVVPARDRRFYESLLDRILKVDGF